MINDFADRPMRDLAVRLVDDILAARTWQAVRDRIATTETDLAKDLLIPPKPPHARVLGRAEWERLLDLVLAAAPMWPGWRVYRVSPPGTPESRLSGGEGLPRTGLVGKPVPLGLPRRRSRRTS